MMTNVNGSGAGKIGRRDFFRVLAIWAAAYTESGPDFARICSSLSPISSIAWSQERRVHAPFTSFIG